MKNKGFTLLEMVVVVSVLAALFLLAIPNIKLVLDMVDEKGCDAQVKVADTAIIEFKLIYGQYPNSVNDLVNAGLLSKNQVTCPNGKLISVNAGQAYAK